MILAKSRVDAERSTCRYTTTDGLETSVTSYFGADWRATNGGTDEPPGPEVLWPVAFEVAQDPNTNADPHFHIANQFQVFVRGDGLFGKHPVRSMSVHYAGAYTPYGPICAGSRGIAYITLRNGWDYGPHYMPAQRDELKAGNRKPRAALSPTIDPEAEAALHALAATTRETVVAEASDGLGGWRYRIPPHQSVRGPDPAAGRGQYWLVLAGTDASADAALGALSCTFLSPDEPPRTATAGPDGLDILALQFPR